MKRLLVSIASIVLATVAFSARALPTAGDVQAEIGNGNYQRAETMMLEVVTAKPDSAKAHYLYAEILAHNKRFTQATEEAASAKRLDPSIGFTQPEKFRSFEQLLAREQSAERSATTRTVAPSTTPAARIAPTAREASAPRESGMPSWVLVLGVAAIAVIAWRLMRPKPTPAMGAGGAGTGNAYGQPVPQPGGAGYAPGYAPGYGQPGGPMQGAGSGMLGTGLAVAGGVAAGMFAEKMLEGRREGNGGGNAFASPATPSSDAFAPGLFGGASAENPAARELEQRDVDFGNGGNDWGGDAGGGSGGDSSGGDSDGW